MDIFRPGGHAKQAGNFPVTSVVSFLGEGDVAVMGVAFLVEGHLEFIEGGRGLDCRVLGTRNKERMPSIVAIMTRCSLLCSLFLYC
jgi:hypothetical protein